MNTKKKTKPKTYTIALDTVFTTHDQYFFFSFSDDHLIKLNRKSLVAK